MAYTFNWKSDKISAEDAAELLKREAADYTNNPYTVEVQTDDGGTHLAVIAERDEEGNDPYHKPILNQFMGWRMVWFMMPHGYLDGYGDESE
tara:strand:- start:561 stop:836 length:276 start_codon:yes stop_codon:yes gene_type:complete